jgi:molecular chaperone DnaK (HSP70)
MSPAANAQARYLVGIDLGTTHTVVAYADLADLSQAGIQVFAIEQTVAAGEIDARPLLPSVRYHPAPGEMAEADTRLPWSDDRDAARPIVGEWARVLGSKSHGRAVVSAKSWLSHTAVDRSAPILPWGAGEDAGKISPVEASASYLAHARAAWNRRFPEHPLERQDIVITVPASFDEGARALTLEAARLAGLADIKLLEEPQAACYDWQWRHRRNLAQELAGVRLLLVIDVGGGTTDLSLVRVEPGGEEPKLTRIGVGDHLMLGGDNLDLTLAHLVEHRLSPHKRLNAGELSQVVEQCRLAKERLLSEEAPDAAAIALLGAGSKLIGGARFTELSQAKVKQVVLDGFFPLSGPDELPERKRTSGVVAFGLPYAQDPAISKHIAAFLRQHRTVMQEATGEENPMPDAVLLNGGLFRSPLIARRVLELLGVWRGGKAPRQLRNNRPDQAVAYGAVAYNLARRGLSARKIGGGSARAYFLLIGDGQDETKRGVCLLPRGIDEGVEVMLAERVFALRLGQPVRFHLVSSVADAQWNAGDLAVIDEERFVQLPPLAAAFDKDSSGGRSEVKVRLASCLTEVGALRIQCVDAADPERRWNVEFQLRGRAAAPVLTGGGLHPRAGEALELLSMVYGKKARIVDAKRLKGLRAELEKILGKREDWDTPLLRELFGALLEGLPHRRRTDAHERQWLSLTGYCLRPGFGFPLDDWRVEQVLGIYEQGVQYHAEPQNWAEWWTLWRRIAGGLSADFQGKIFADLSDYLNPDKAKRGNLQAQAKKRGYEDMLRLAAVLERLPLRDKIELGGWLLRRLDKAGEPSEIGWALGRVGARIPFHAGAENVVPSEVAEEWLSALLSLDWKKQAFAGFAAALIARMSGDRARDVAETARVRVIDKLRAAKAPESWLDMVQKVKELDEADEKRLFGEALPPGLKLLD